MIQSIAAALLVASSLYIFFQNSKEPTTLRTGNATITAHTFADKSEVYLNADTDVSYNDNNWNKSRKINLDGEAYFEVNKGNDFIVSTNQGSVRVLGTKFNVKQRANTLHVSCYEGSVAVSSNNTEKILVAGQGISFYNSGTTSEYKISSDQPE